MRVDEVILHLSNHGITARKVVLNRHRGIWILELSREEDGMIQPWPLRFYSENPHLTEHEMDMIRCVYRLPEDWNTQSPEIA